MKINISIEVTEETRRRVRAHFGRCGQCTRNEYRVWINHLIAGGLEALPAPKVRACNTSRQKPADPALVDARKAHTPETPCGICGAPLETHLGRRLSCPLSKRVKPGSTFELVRMELPR